MYIYGIRRCGHAVETDTPGENAAVHTYTNKRKNGGSSIVAVAGTGVCSDSHRQ